MSAKLRQLSLDEGLCLKRIRVIARGLGNQVDPIPLRNRPKFRPKEPFLGRRQDFRNSRLHNTNLMPSGGEVKP